MLSTRKSDNTKPMRVLIFGQEGSGKTSFGASSEKPIFICPEGGIDHLDNAIELTGSENWLGIRKAIKSLATEDHEYKTLVLDSADWIEKLCHAEVMGSGGRSIITCNGGYGAGYRESERLHRELIEDLSVLREKKGMNIIVCAHYAVRTVKDPEAVSDYDAFEIKCHEFVSSLWREWVDCVLFVRFRTYLKKGSADKGKTLALGTNERVVYTEKRPAFQAKNRYNLPPEMDFGKDYWSVFIKACKKVPPEKQVSSNDKIDQVKIDIDKLMSEIPQGKTRDSVSKYIDQQRDNLDLLIVARRRLREMQGDEA